MKKYILLLSIFLTGVTYGQHHDKKLYAKLQDLLKSFNGDIGIYVKNLKNGKTVAYNADTVFPTASII